MSTLHASAQTLSPGTAFQKDVLHTVRQYLAFFPKEQERLSTLITNLSNENLDLRLRSTIPEGHMCASGILLLPGSKILMLEHKALHIWVVPGGHYDISDKDLTATALRETIEETGIKDIEIHPWHLQHGIPLDIDTHPIPANDKKNEGAHQHFDFRYVLRAKYPEHVISNLKLNTNEALSYKLMSVQDVDQASSISPALKKLDLLKDV